MAPQQIEQRISLLPAAGKALEKGHHEQRL
jgi:hypothetical protein